MKRNTDWKHTIRAGKTTKYADVDVWMHVTGREQHMGDAVSLKETENCHNLHLKHCLSFSPPLTRSVLGGQSKRGFIRRMLL